ncbi:hypothetical protein EDD22DRAFT_962603 [Suillus occidentalis]|nr:hypothetical protein EDD22DRAFT_962603 [Suillus occidentalis]
MNYYSKLWRMTSSMFPHLVPVMPCPPSSAGHHIDKARGKDRYRELMRVARQWRQLKTMKWHGFGHRSDDPSTGELALFCLACPQPGINVLLSEDESFDDTNLKQVISSDLVGPIPDWAEKVVSQAQLKPSAPPSVRVSGKTAQPTKSDVDLDDKPEEYSEPAPKARRGKNIVHLKEKPKVTLRGKKHSLPVPDEIELSAEGLEDPDNAEEQEILEDPEADEEPENLEDPDDGADSDFKMLEDEEDDGSDSAMVVNKASMAQHTSSMLVDVAEQKPATKQAKGHTTRIKAEVKTEPKPEVVASENIRVKLKKCKARNAYLPSGVLENGICNHAWTIPETELESALKLIFYEVYPCNKGGCSFNVEDLSFHLEAHKEYAEYQLQDCHFIYEDPDNEDQPGAFLSEYILHIFAAHLTAVTGRVRVDSLVEFGKPGYQTALALTAVAAECALVLVKDQLLIDSNPADNGGKSHKIVQTLNEVTNKMSNTGTAFSSGNWETDTLAYMDSIKTLPHECIQEILKRSENYMKNPHFNHRSSTDDSSNAPVNKRSCLHICNEPRGRIIFFKYYHNIIIPPRFLLFQPAAPPHAYCTRARSIVWTL